MQNSKFLTVALEAARKSEKIIMKHFREGIETRLKEDGTPVAVADVEAENIILQTIKKHFPDHGFLGEESGRSGQDHGSGYLWVIDPIDSTKNYERGMSAFATQIALMKDNELVLGVSNAPALGELMYAEKNRGAYLNENRIRVSSLKNIPNTFMSFGGLKYFDKQNKMSPLISLSKDTRGSKGFGDFWSYHLLAQGKIDIMIEAGTKIWDIAACKVIVEEAGGKVTDLNGESINTDTTSVLATNGLIHDKILKYFK
jgi:histidinol-phosphatase